MRVLGLSQSAEADWKSLDSTTQAALEAYAAGVNAFLLQAKGRLPLEFKILGITPEEWTPVDSLAFGKLVAWGLSANYRDELIVAQLMESLSWPETRSILPDYPGPDVILEANAALHSSSESALQSALLLPSFSGWERPDQGSNAWVVGGSHTASGKPLLAGDPHQTMTMPSLWYEVGLYSNEGSYHVVGGSLPGLPGVEIGHNEQIAWAVTNARLDVQDLFVESLDAAGEQYRFQGAWRPLQKRKEIIHVKGGEAVELTVRTTHHGPLLSDTMPGSSQTLALRWTGLDQGRPLAQSILQLDRAANWQEFRAALARWQLPGMNFVYADRSGNIGFQVTGAAPIRANNEAFSLRPVDGASGRYEWKGVLAADQLPSAINPRQDFFASANNRQAGANYPHFLSHYFQPPDRAVEITRQLRNSRQLTRSDFARLQANWRCETNLRVARILVREAAPIDAQLQPAIAALQQWDGDMQPDSVAASLSELSMMHILKLTLGRKLDAPKTEAYMQLSGYPYLFLRELLDRPEHPWWDKQRPQILAQALQAATRELRQKFGEDESNWTWGAVHTYTFSHPLGKVALLRPIFNRGPYPTGGNWNTVNSGAYTWDNDYAMNIGPAYRIISDPSDWDASMSVLPGGQSGHPFDSHYDDQARSWLKVEYHSLPFTPEAIERASADQLELQP